MKRCDWLKTVASGVAIAFLAMPLTTQGATTAQKIQHFQQNQALTSGNGTTKGDVTTANLSAMRKQRHALHAQKSALLKERRALAKRGDKAALNKNSARLDALDVQLNAGKKGGTKL